MIKEVVEDKTGAPQIDHKSAVVDSKSANKGKLKDNNTTVMPAPHMVPSKPIVNEPMPSFNNLEKKLKKNGGISLRVENPDLEEAESEDKDIENQGDFDFDSQMFDMVNIK